MTRRICISAVDGNTGFAIAELVLKHRDFSRRVDSVVGLALDAESELATELRDLGATIVPHVPGRVGDVVKALEDSGADTVCVVPPARGNKLDMCAELVEAAGKARVSNVCLISSAGCDYADPKRQPRLREFIDLEALVLAAKGDAGTPTGTSPCVIRAVFYAENLLLHGPQAKQGILPLPIGESHKFAPVALGDVAHIAARVLTGKGKHGFDDRHRGQMMVVTGPKLCAGNELATAASNALGTEMKFEDISAAEAKTLLKSQSESDASEQQYLLEYYSLVREGKTNYIATTAFHDVTGEHPTEPDEFFRLYQSDMRPNKKAKHRRK
ncbi:NAD(P)-binding domain protein [Metarhizium album ARSEF 1941]|uniref:NAD(P)-binding domain protein n=1 Tax=Metarhizium album (strain ARSEF 1941) TaxID=1081103 RepID=A0A0B2WL89_METAS|nr:NAD(P)-binding domain protein [Metarhizium album ARSEF 1941]KHN96821.1 NAD(P)-binding domain protein [Metarhizium album ARSEF 1941]